MEKGAADNNYREEDPGRERRRLKLIKRLGLKGNKYNLFVLETLKKSKRGKLEEEGGWQEVSMDGEYILEIANPEHVDIKMDWDEFMKLNCEYLTEALEKCFEKEGDYEIPLNL